MQKIVLLQGIKFRDTIIITLKGTNKDLFKEVGDYNVVMFPAIIDDECAVSAKIDHPMFKTARIDHILTSTATVQIEGVNDNDQKQLFFNKKPIKRKIIDALLGVLNSWERKEKARNLLNGF